MIVVRDGNFRGVYAQLCSMMKFAPKVRTERWQGVDVRADPAAASYELRNVCFDVDLKGIEGLQHWRDDCAPNLPWADDHFAERVCGYAMNPGEEWKNWPWATSADRFRDAKELGPRMSPQDWAYLAGMLDGDGTLYYRPDKLPAFQGTLRVYQKDRDVLDHLERTFRVGKVAYCGDRKTTTPSDPDGPPVPNGMHQWAVGAVAEIRWLLDGVAPYLHVKSAKAQVMLNAIERCLDNPNGAPLKKVWDQDWPARFNINYMDRFWPKRLEGGSPLVGMSGNPYGDLDDFVALLAAEPYTRQAWFPMFHPDETGTVANRKMCSLGYQVLVRDEHEAASGTRAPRAHIYYPLRSCDLIRHFRDDCYLAVRLLLWIVDRCRELDDTGFWNDVRPGSYAMHCTSLHVFENDRRSL